MIRALLGAVGLWVLLNGSSTSAASLLAFGPGNKTYNLATADSELQIYPPLPAIERECGESGASFQRWSLYRAPSDYDPLNWDSSEWRHYLVEYPLRSAGLSLALTAIVLLALALVVIWRLVQWCAGCGSCRRACSGGAEEAGFLGDTKHSFLKGWVLLLLALCLGMVVWAMLALDADLLRTFWTRVEGTLSYGDRIGSGLDRLEAQLQVELPARLDAVESLVVGLVDPTRLADSVREILRFTASTRPRAEQLAANTAAMQAQLDGTVLPGLAELQRQGRTGGGGGGAAGRRSLLAGPVPASSATAPTLGPLLVTLGGGLPLMANASAAQTAARTSLGTLAAALGKLRAGGPPSAAAVQQLQAVLAAVQVAAWSDKVAGLTTGLQAYGAFRSGAALESAASTAERVAATDLVSGPLLNDTAEALEALEAQLRGGPKAALQALSDTLHNISANVVNLTGAGADSWAVRLSDGTKVPIVSLVYDLNTYLGSYFSDGTDNGTAVGGGGTAVGGGGGGGGRRLLAAPAVPAPFNLSSFIKDLRTGGVLAGTLNHSLIRFASAARATAAAAADGPDPAAAIGRVNTTFRADLAALAPPTSALTSAASAYAADRSAANLLALRAAADAAAGPLATALADASVPLPDADRLVAAASSLRPSVAALAAVAGPLNASLPVAVAVLSDFGGASLAPYRKGIKQYTDFLAQLPGEDELVQLIQDLSAQVRGQVANLTAGARSVARAAAKSVSDISNTLEDDLMHHGRQFAEDYRDDSLHGSHVVYSVWMAAWGAGALLVLVLAAAVWLNWPAGILSASLLLLLLVLVSQVLCVALSVGMSALEDGCTHVERVALQHIVMDTRTPQTSVLLSHVLYDVPASRDLALLASFKLNSTRIKQQLRSANDTLVRTLRDKYDTSGALRDMLDGIMGLSGQLVAELDDTLQMVGYEQVNPQYLSVKEVACCRGNSVAFVQWCAMTIFAFLFLGALVAALYLLARMDMLRLRSGCCGCCACACYRPQPRALEAGPEVDEVPGAAVGKQPDAGQIAASSSSATGSSSSSSIRQPPPPASEEGAVAATPPHHNPLFAAADGTAPYGEAAALAGLHGLQVTAPAALPTAGGAAAAAAAAGAGTPGGSGSGGGGGGGGAAAAPYSYPCVVAPSAPPMTK